MILHRTAIYELSIAEVLQLTTVRKSVQPPIPGFIYLTYYALFIRNGPRYLTFPGNLVLRATGITINHVTAIGSTIGTGTGDANNRYALMVPGLSVSSITATDATTGIGSKGIEFALTSTVPTVDATNPGAPFKVIHEYSIIPTYPSLLENIWLGGGDMRKS